MLQKFSYCSPNVKYCIFKSYCVTMYCSSMWSDCNVSSMKKLKIAYDNGLRRLLNLPKCIRASEMFVNLSILSFSELLQKFVCSFIWAWWSDILDIIPITIVILCVDG